MSDEERRLVRQGIRDKYAMSVGAVQPAAPLQTQASPPPTSADSNVETDAAAKEWRRKSLGATGKRYRLAQFGGLLQSLFDRLLTFDVKMDFAEGPRH